MSSIVEKILNQYGVEYSAVGPAQKGYRNSSFPVKQKSGGMLNLIIYKNESDILSRIKAAHLVAEIAARNGLPVRYPLDPRIIQVRQRSNRRYAALYNWLPGSTIPWEAYTKEHIKLLGAMLSDLHRSLKDVHDEELPRVTNEYQAIFQNMREYFLRPGVITALSSKLSLQLKDETIPYLQKILKYAGALPRSQALHMDFVRGNILFLKDVENAVDNEDIKSSNGHVALQISGIVDFEKATVGNPVFDVARTLAFLLVDCKYKPLEKTKKYFLQSGYHKRGAGSLQHDEMQFLEPLVSVFMVHDFYKFLLHNPYEYLQQNEHFVRTIDQLVERGILARS